jgi:hypothetical protein
MVERARSDAAFQGRREAALARYTHLLSRLDGAQVDESAPALRETVAAR